MEAEGSTATDRTGGKGENGIGVFKRRAVWRTIPWFSLQRNLDSLRNAPCGQSSLTPDHPCGHQSPKPGLHRTYTYWACALDGMQTKTYFYTENEILGNLSLEEDWAWEICKTINIFVFNSFAENFWTSCQKKSVSLEPPWFNGQKTPVDMQIWG